MAKTKNLLFVLLAAFLMTGLGLHMTQTAGLALASDRATDETRSKVVALLYVAIGASLVAYRCWGLGVQRAGPNAAAFFSNLTPLFAAILSAAFLGEMPRAYHAFAFLLIVGGIVVSSRR